MKKTTPHSPKPNKSGKSHAKAGASRAASKPAGKGSPGRGGKAAGRPVGKVSAPRAKTSSLCPVSGVCGACQSIDVPYEQQLAEKQAYIEKLFAGIVPASVVRPILGMQDPFHYRNKVISPYARGKKLPPKPGKSGGRAARYDILTGMYAKGTHKLVPTDTCLLENKVAKKVTLAVRDIMLRFGVEPYDEDAHEGFLRHAVVRVGHESGEVLVTLVTNGSDFPSSKAFCRELVKRVPQVTTVVQSVNTRQTNVILGTEERTLYGPGFILDTLCGLSFRISSHSFYQVNATQTEVLYEKAIEFAQLSGSETVIDAYCGTGTIGLVAAKRGAARVIGVDSVKQAIVDAKQNARHNGVENAEFIAEDASAFMRNLAGRREAFTADAGEGSHPAGATAAANEELVLFMDPPRAGSTPEFLEAAEAMAPARIVYISCNPVTQVRDIEHLQRAGYRLEAVQPVDMFPHTRHVETVVLLSRKDVRE